MSPSLALIKKKKSKKLSHSFNCTLIRVFTCVAFFLSSESKTSTTRRKYKETRVKLFKSSFLLVLSCLYSLKFQQN